MLVKLCGTTNLEDAQLAVEQGADALGFIFAPSRRRVTAGQAAAVIRQLPRTVELVGVFTDSDAASILQTAAVANLSSTQLHTTYDSDLIEALTGRGLRLWQVITLPVGESMTEARQDEFIRTLRLALEDSRLDAVLLDASSGGRSGGMGIRFDWQLARNLLDRATEPPLSRRARLILAGGLTPENVREAITVLQPDGVDVVSGVESSPGRKDPVRVSAFIQAARSS